MFALLQKRGEVLLKTEGECVNLKDFFLHAFKGHTERTEMFEEDAGEWMQRTNWNWISTLKRNNIYKINFPYLRAIITYLWFVNKGTKACLLAYVSANTIQNTYLDWQMLKELFKQQTKSYCSENLQIILHNYLSKRKSQFPHVLKLLAEENIK